MIGYNEKYQAIKVGQIYGIYSVCATQKDPTVEMPWAFRPRHLCLSQNLPAKERGGKQEK